MKFINSNLKAISKFVLFGACCIAISFAAGCSGSDANSNGASKDGAAKSEPAGSGTSKPAGSDKK